MPAPAKIRPSAQAVLAAAGIVLTLYGPARAQTIVHDPTSYGSLIQQAQTALKQLDQLKQQVSEAQRLYDGLNLPSQVNRLAQALQTPELRSFLPDADAFAKAARGDLSALGQLGERAKAIREQTRLYAAPAHDPTAQDLEHAGDRAARDLAIGQEAAKVGAERRQGLQQLANAIDTAPTARAVLDLQARLAAEQALALNDQMRLQGLVMAQAAEDRMARQREKERAEAARDARMAAARRSFQ